MQDNNITTENWGFPPYNRWGFQHVQNLFPTTRIRRGAGPISALPHAPSVLDDLTFTNTSGVSSNVKQMLADTYTDAFLVLKDGVIVTEQYFTNPYGAMQADSHHLMNSVTKSFIGVLVGIQIDQGKLQVDQRVADILPELAHTAFADTTIRTALDMSAAVAFDEDYANPQADFWVETSVVGWRPALVKPGAPKSLQDYALSLTQTDQQEGEKYHYRTVLTNVLGMCLQAVTGVPLPALLEQQLWSKLGPEQDACIVVDRTGFPYVGAGMNACARDLARFGQLIVQQGRFGDEQIVSQAWIDDIRYADPHAKQIFAASEYGEFLPGGHYRNKFWVSDAGRGVLLAIGIHGQTIHMNMSTGTVIVKFSSQPESADLELFTDTFAAMDAIAESLG
ncbi:MAG: serine hydrolase [Pseudomonadota bacterium]|nr:serine hydrolase [Pseudomonadota bacterium]